MDYHNKYRYYKDLYKQLIKGGRCRPFSTKDCLWNPKYNKCSEVDYDINRNQNVCICNDETRQCVVNYNAPGKSTMKMYQNKMNQ